MLGMLSLWQPVTLTVAERNTVSMAPISAILLSTTNVFTLLAPGLVSLNCFKIIDSAGVDSDVDKKSNTGSPRPVYE